MRARFLQSPVAAVAAITISLPVGVPAANVAADNANQPSVALSASAHSFDKLAETPGLKLVLSAVDSVVEIGAGLAAAAAPQFELLALPDSIAALVTKDGTGAVPSTFIDAGRTAAGNIVAGLNASSASPLAAPIDVPIPDSVLDLLNQPLSILYGFTSGLAEPTIPLQKLLIALGNYAGLPINIAGLAALGQFDLIPTTIESITKALNAAWAGLSPVSALSAESKLAASPLAASPLAAPIDVPIPDSVLDLLNLPLSILYGFTSGLAEPTIPLQKLLIALGNYAGLPINIAGLAALGQFDLIPTTIESITKALNAAWAGLSPVSALSAESKLAASPLAASPLAAPIDVPIPDSVLDLLNLPLSILYGFTSGRAEPTIPLQKLLIAAGNYVGLPINIAGLAALGQFDLIPTTIDSITKALTAAWAGLSPSATAASTLAEAALDTDSVDDDKDTLKATTGDEEVDGASGAFGSGASIDDGTSNGGQPTGTAKPDAEDDVAENEAENTDGVDREDGEDGATPGTSTPGTGTAGSGSGTNGTPGEPGSHSDDADGGAEDGADPSAG